MRVHEGEEIVLTRSLEPVPAVDAPPYRIGLTLAQAFADAEVGDRVSSTTDGSARGSRRCPTTRSPSR